MATAPSDAARTYTLPQLAELTGVDYRTLHNWVRKGLVQPSHQSATGSGSVNLFGVEDAVQLYVLAELRQAGLEVRVLEAVAKPLRSLTETLAGDELLVIGEGVATITTPDEIGSKIAASGGPVLIYPSERARAAVEG